MNLSGQKCHHTHNTGPIQRFLILNMNTWNKIPSEGFPVRCIQFSYHPNEQRTKWILISVATNHEWVKAIYNGKVINCIPDHDTLVITFVELGPFIFAFVEQIVKLADAWPLQYQVDVVSGISISRKISEFSLLRQRSSMGSGLFCANIWISEIVCLNRKLQLMYCWWPQMKIM